MTIDSEIARLQGAKSSMKTSIENKGVTVPSSANVDDYAGYIDQIDQGGEWEFQPSEYTVSYHKLEENSNDFSGNGHNGTNTDITYETLSTGKKVALFNGTSSYISLGDYEDSKGGDNWTYCVRFRILGSPYGCVYSHGSANSNGMMYGLSYGTSNSLFYGISYYYGTGFPKCEDTDVKTYTTNGDFHNIIWTNDHGIFKLYIDGKLIQTVDNSSQTFSYAQTSRNYIGCLWDRYSFDFTNFFNGNISEQIIEKRTWTYDDVMEYYSHTKYYYPYIYLKTYDQIKAMADAETYYTNNAYWKGTIEMLNKHPEDYFNMLTDKLKITYQTFSCMNNITGITDDNGNNNYAKIVYDTTDKEWGTCNYTLLTE